MYSKQYKHKTPECTILHQIVLVFLLLGIAVYGQTQSQPPPYFLAVQHFNEEDGLSHNSVRCINKDERGIIWVGTDYGLNRFDGKRFKTYTSRHGLRSNKIHNILADGHRLWLISQAKTGGEYFNQIDVFDSYEGQAVPFETYYRDEIPFDWAQLKFFRVADQTLFFRLYNGKRFAFDLIDEWQYLGQFSAAETLMGKDQYRHYWSKVIQEDSIYLVKRKAGGAELGRIAFPVNNFNAVRWFHKHKSGQVSFLLNFDTQENKTFLLDISPNMQYQRQLLAPDPTIEPMGVYYKSEYLPAFNAIWSAENGDILVYLPDETPLLKDTSAAQMLNNKLRFNLVEGRTVWQCGDNGFYSITVKENPFHNIFSDFNTPTNSFRGITQVDSSIYMGCAAGLFPLQQAFRALPKPISPHNVLVAETIRDKKLLLTHYHSLSIFDINRQTQTLLPLPFQEYWSAYEDHRGYIWLSQSGLCRLNPADGKIDDIDYSQFPELQYNTIYHFYELDTNRVLLCSTSGLYELDPDQGITARYWEGGKGEHQLPASDFRHLYHDKEAGVFWLATGQKGLVRWQPATNSCQNFTFHEGITNVIHGVYPDNYGHLWMSTQHGIVQFDRSSHDFIIYTTQDGLKENEFNRISHFQHQDGTLYFGHLSGVTYFYPKGFENAFNQKRQVRPTLVELQQYLGRDNQLVNMTADYQMQQRIVLRPDDRYFTMTLGLDDVRWANEAVFQYKLDRQQEEWAALEGNQVTVGRLPYGRQNIRVRVLLSNGQFSAKTLAIPVWVKRPFYLQWWFGLILIALIALLIYARTRQLDQRNKELEAEVQRRTAEIQKDQELIAQQAAELKQLDDLKSRFFANLSHELRTPLTLIIGPLSQLLQQTRGSNYHRLAEMAHGQSRKLLRLVNDIMDLSKLESTALEVDPQPTPLLPFLKQALSPFELYAEREGIRLGLEYRAPKDLAVNMDAKKVETILYNYLANATKYTPAGGLVQLKAAFKGQQLRFEVKDTGRGIPAADLPRVFERYFQSSVNTKAEGGTGLGLALSKELAKLLGAQVWAESQEGIGSSFFLELSGLSVSSSFDPSVTGSTHAFFATTPIAPLQEQKPQQPATVLIVEDQHDMQDYLLSLLQPHYNTLTASNGQAALELLEQSEQLPDLILTDLMMPVMNGYTLMKKLKQQERYQSIPLVVLTAKASLEDRLTALRVGVDDYLGKPFVAEELLVRVRNLLQNAAIRKQAAAPALQTAATDDVEALIPAPKQQAWLAKLEKTVSEHLDDQQFSVDFLAEKLGLSRHTLNRRVKAKVGLTTTQYLQEFRLHHARKLLENGEATSVSAAAQACGISDTKYFSRLFKKRFGQPPSYYL